MLRVPVKAVGLATIMVAGLFLQSCTVLLTRQEQHIHNTLDHNLVEVKRSERILELVEEGAIQADGVVVKFLQQYNTVITNNTESIRKLINGEPSELPEE